MMYPREGPVVVCLADVGDKRTIMPYPPCAWTIERILDPLWRWNPLHDDLVFDQTDRTKLCHRLAEHVWSWIHIKLSGEVIRDTEVVPTKAEAEWKKIHLRVIGLLDESEEQNPPNFRLIGRSATRDWLFKRLTRE